MPSAADDLAALIAACDWFMAVLAALRAADLPDAWPAPGPCATLVWGSRFGRGFHPADVRDVDVAFFDPLRSDSTICSRACGGAIPAA